MAKTDLGVQYADKEFLKLERRLEKLYTEAGEDVQKKMNVFFSKYKKKDKIMRQKVKDGDITKQEYISWLKGQIFQGKQWRYRMESIASTLSNVNEVAISMVNDTMPKIFQVNGNYAAYQLEKSAGVEFGFNIYNPETIRQLIAEDAHVLPFKKLNKAKDMTWNFQAIKNEVAKGIIEGESIDKITNRLATVIPNRNKAMLRTHARTMCTSAQNLGRLKRFEEAQAKGIDMEKEWFATLDGRTRDTHRLLDRQKQPLDEPFKVDGMEIMFPADPHAHPSLTYNCRCTMNSYIKAYPPKYTTRRDNESKTLIADMSYSEWEKWKETQT